MTVKYTKGFASVGPNEFINTCLVIFVFVLGFYFFNQKRKQLAKQSENVENKVFGLEDVPGPPEYFGKFIGSFPRFWPYSKALANGIKLASSFDGMAKISGANKTFVGLHCAPLVQQFLKSTEFGHCEKTPIPYTLVKPVISKGVLVSNGKLWQSQRKILMRTQSFQNLKHYMKMWNTHTKHFVEDLKMLFKDGQPHQINQEIKVLFLKIINEMITGNGKQSMKELHKYHQNIQILKESTLKRMLEPWLLLNPLWRLHPMSKLQDKAVEEINDFAIQKINEHREIRKRKDKIQNDTSEVKNMLDELLDAGVDDDQIRDEVNTITFAGHETGATTIHFFCFCISLNPTMQDACRKEIDSLFENSDCFNNGMITYEAVQSNLKYVERCIQETLRLFPPVFMFLRELTTPLTLVHRNKTFVMPVGTNITVSPYGIHRSPENYPDPEKFDPDRFLPEEVAKRHPYSFVPFSGGSRSCLGQKFAMLEMKVVAAYLLRNFEITTTDKIDDIAILPFLTLTPEKDYTFIFKRRNITVT